MKNISTILFLLILSFLVSVNSYSQSRENSFDFFGDQIEWNYDFKKVEFSDYGTSVAIKEFYSTVELQPYSLVVDALTGYRQENKPDDWLFYQLIRKTAEHFSPKAENYHRYTLFKWYFLKKTGYNPLLTIYKDKILLYVQSDENIYEIPFRIKNGKQFICLNYHDYGSIDFSRSGFVEVDIDQPDNLRSFTYRITKLPNFSESDYQEKDIRFDYRADRYEFRIKVNNSVKSIFANYPVQDYEKYFNIPMSEQTYNSLIPLLKKHTKKLSQKSGIEYLMDFTRYAFVYKTDTELFGKEKRLSPEQTLFHEFSDCEDRAALFFYLVKEIYNLPMIVLAYPEHVTIAVKFDKPTGEPIIYNGERYSVCEPTPQQYDLKIGQLPASVQKAKYEVVYVYQPSH